MKLNKGTLKVIVTDGRAIVENAARARNGGKIFVPPYVVYEWDQDALTLDRHHAFALRTPVTAKSTVNSFPYQWAPSELRDHRAWMETTGELLLVTHYSPQE